MAEKKLNGGNSISKKTFLDTGQSLLPHFRTSFASTNTDGSKPRRYLVSTAKPTSSPVAGPNSATTSSNSLEKAISSENAKPTSSAVDGPNSSTTSRNSLKKTKSLENAKHTSSPVAGSNSASASSNSLEKPKSLENAGSNSRTNILPHYRTSFATCNVGGGISRKNSTTKPSSSSNEGDVIPQKDSKKNSTTDKKPTSSNPGNSFLPYYRTSFMTCSVVANSRTGSTGKQTPSLNNKENKTRPPLHVRASNGSCHDSCKPGLRENEEKPRVTVTKRSIPRPPIKHNHDRKGISQDEKKKSVAFNPTYLSDSDTRSSKQKVSISYKTRNCSFKSRPPIIEKPCVSSEVLNRLNEKRNSELNTMASPRSSVGQNRSLNLSKCKSLKLNSPPRPQIIKQKTMYVPSRSCQEIETISEVGNENQNEIVVVSPPPPLSSSESSSSSYSNLLVCSSEDTFSETEYEYTDDESDYYESEYSDEESLSETDEDTNAKDGEIPKRRTRGKLVQNVGEDCSSVKLKFKRGKIVEKDNSENGSKKLKFPRGRMLESKEVENGPSRRIYRRIVSSVTKHKTSPKAEKVELKHQELEEKKDQQLLLNEVIEETASKLVEERKGKVRALVGAFETVLVTTDSSPNTPTKA